MLLNTCNVTVYQFSRTAQQCPFLVNVSLVECTRGAGFRMRSAEFSVESAYVSRWHDWPQRCIQALHALPAAAHPVDVAGGDPGNCVSGDAGSDRGAQESGRH